jgi:hypothetical protein
MVVERKTIQWPKQFLHSHSHWHRLADFLACALTSVCPEPLTVSIRSDCLHDLSKRQVDRVGELIVQQVRAGSEAGLVTSTVGKPMPWRIHSGLFSAPAGTRIEVLDWSGEFWPEPDEFWQLREEQISGFRNELEMRLTDVEKKLSRFPDHYKVLLLQFVGESSALIEETDLAPIVKVAQEASFVDEVWIATKEWISEDDYEIGWVPAPGGT